MRLTFSTEDGRVVTLDIDETESLQNLSALLEAEMGIPMAQQALLHNGVILNALPVNLHKSIVDLGVHAEDMIGVHLNAAGAGRARRRPGTGLIPPAKRPNNKIDPELYPLITWDDISSDVSPDTLHAILQVNSGMMQAIQTRDPELHAAASAPTAAALRTIMMTRNLQRALPEAERAARLASLEARLAKNPYDVEAQRLLEDEIANKNIEENRLMAMEHMPESFARVAMLYIPAKINGVMVKVFVDSGAQSTILSKKCAEHCNIMRLVDQRFSGQAVGVGTARIIGRVHMAPLVIAEHHFSCTFTVLDQNDMDCLLGLDMLKRFQCCIDLSKNVLRLRLGAEDVEVPFLGEAEIPQMGERTEMDATGHAGGPAVSATHPSAATAGSGAMVAPSPVQAATKPSPASAGSFAPLDLGTLKPAGAPKPGSSQASRTATISSPSLSAQTSSPASSTVGTFDLSSLMPSKSVPASTASPAPTRSPAVPAPSVAAVSSSANEGSINALMGMGFPRNKCIQALEMSNGDVEVAAALLPEL